MKSLIFRTMHSSALRTLECIALGRSATSDCETSNAETGDSKTSDKETRESKISLFKRSRYFSLTQN